MVTCTLVNTPKHGGQWCGSSDVVMIFARVRRSFGVSMQVINGVGSIEYFVCFSHFYKYITGLVSFVGNHSIDGAAIVSPAAE